MERVVQIMLMLGVTAVVAGPVRGAPPMLDEPTVMPLPGLPAPIEVADQAAGSTIPEPIYLAVFGAGILLLLRRRG